MTDQRAKAQTEEHPIIFSGWSIRSILAGEKTQTRRIVKPQPEKIGADVWAYNGLTFYDDEAMRSRLFCEAYRGEGVSYPYGMADRMWVREAFRFDKAFDDCSPADLVRSKKHPTLGPEDIHYEATPEESVFSEETMGRKRPPIFMPRELCRLRLRVEDVRVERVQEVTEEGVRAEGWSAMHDILHGSERLTKRWCRMSKTMDPDSATATLRGGFAVIWDEINGDRDGGAYIWEKNPWVWVVSFSKLDK